jgi:MoaA/NifB/PqqE/SkfB family radical SAM enzyme
MKAINKVLGLYLERRMRSKPPVLRIETTNACNASCVTCPRPHMTRTVGIMSMDLFRRAVSQARELGMRSVHLHNYGEPLLDRELGQKIALAKSEALSVKIFTNASLLSRARAEELVSSGIDGVKISMDGVSRETFERVRKNLTFDDVMSGIENLVTARGDRTRPRISLVFVAFDENRSEIKALRSRWAGRVDSIHVTRYHNWANEGGGRGSFRERLQKTVPCARLWKTMTVLWDGRVALCCLDYNGEVILGNAAKESLMDIWDGDRYRELRRLHLSGEQEKIPLCKTCTIGRL